MCIILCEEEALVYTDYMDLRVAGKMRTGGRLVTLSIFSVQTTHHVVVALANALFAVKMRRRREGRTCQNTSLIIRLRLNLYAGREIKSSG